MKGFDTGVVGMAKGQEKTIKIIPKEAYGDPNPELIRKFPRASIPPEAQEGMMLALKTPDGQQLPARIAKLDEKDATIDLNHPLAGKTLNFKIKIVEVA